MVSTFNRRAVMAGLASFSATGAAALAGEVAPSLRSLAAAKGILFGSAVGAGKAGTLTGSFHDPAYRDLLASQCSVIVPENEMKIYVIAGRPDAYNYEPADQIAAFARQNGLKLRGHTLFWNNNSYLPKWVMNYDFGASPATSVERFLRDYIEKVCRHFGDQVYSWDVVNETIDPKTGQLRDTPFNNAVGFDSIRIAFEAARDFAPKAQRVYNDYMSWEKGNETHRSGVLRLLEQLRKKNVPVDALGIQSHLGNDGNIKSAQLLEWRKFVDEVVGMGYRLLITELDVSDKDLPTQVDVRDTVVASTARDYLDMMLSYNQLDQVLCWGLVDKYNWLQKWTPRKDGLPQRPTPFDDAYRQKPLYEAIAAALRSAPKR